MTPVSREEASALDDKDPLAHYKTQFDLPDGVIYLDGNSLGPPPKAALARIQSTGAAEWRGGLIKSWNEAGWIDLPKTCGAKIARLIGAREDEVIVADSVSVNIFKLAAALCAKAPGAIAYHTDEFPTDGYILQGLSNLTGAPLIRLAADAGHGALHSDISVLVKSVVHYKTASIADIAVWEKAAAQANVAIIWDLSHATGIIEIDMQAAGARYGVGCGYKYLNGGPGAPAFVYVERQAAATLNQPLSGWMGHAAPFDFAPDYAPAAGVERFACGTPPILSLSALDAALDMFADLDIAALEAKAKMLGDLFLARCAALGLESVSPPPSERRGGHVSVRFEHGYEVIQALIAHGVIGDFRQPDLMRFGFSPLFLGYGDVWDAASMLANILGTEEWRAAKYSARRKVT
jgi:kynureninase